MLYIFGTIMYYLDLEIGIGILCHHTINRDISIRFANNFKSRGESFVLIGNDKVQFSFRRQRKK